jgi:glyoxylase-like metal-dependent hydrolase (beta-lactamase superfamily II)
MTNTYAVADDDGACLVIDPGFDIDELAAEIDRRGWQVRAIVTTHGHFDHIAGNRVARERWSAPLWMHPATVELATNAGTQARWFGLSSENSPPPDRTFEHGQVLTIGALTFEVRAVPGHCPGSVALVCPGHVFVGDVLFAGSIGRSDLPHSDSWQLMASIRDQLMTLPDDTVVYPGHGETTTIGEERRHNPFRREWENLA